MNIANDAETFGLNARAWAQRLDPYRRPSRTRGVAELALTAVPLAALWGAAWLFYSLGLWWVSLLLAVPAAVFLVRMFAIQHDCGHGAFFAEKWENDWVGRALSVLTITPYDFWRRMHAVHHATAGNLTRRGVGDVETLTVAEYRARTRLGRLKYRLYRHPIVLFGLGPAYVFLVQNRLPVGLPKGGLKSWISTQSTNAAIALISLLTIWLIGLEAFLLINLPIVILAATLGVWLFYVQHQFEDTFWCENRRWSLQEAALRGSSFYDLPAPLRWLTGHIGIHHVHHLCSRIPFYRLPKVLNDHPELRHIGRLTFIDSLRCVRLALWDEDQKRLVSFREAASARARAPNAMAPT